MRDRRNVLRLLAVLCGLTAFACRPDEEESVAPGTYRAGSGDEWIIVTAEKIVFHVNFHVDEPDRLTDKETEYWLEPDGRIMFPITSGEFFTGVGWYEWYWRDGRIAKIDRDTEQTTWFVRAEE